MAKSTTSITIAEDRILNKIYYIRGYKVMLDEDLAELYKVPTKRLNEQVKRNIGRFPADFMFSLTEEEFENLKSQNATSSWGGRRKLPNAFTEHGVLMLSSVLSSERAINVNIQIMRIYTKMREMLLTNQEILLKLEQLERQTLQNTGDIQVVFAHLKQLLMPPEQANRQRIGFRRTGESK
ncbi:MAG TPA: ORF6N domain-containing protein [Puia sp.]|nr:ORF6N domain-containing protein [Puia sp.]